MKNVPIGRSVFRMWLLRSPLGRSVNSTEAATPGKPLNLRQARGIVIGIAVSVILVAALGIHDILIGEKLFAFVCCLIVLGWLAPLAVYIVLYLQVKKGKDIVLRPVFLSLPSSPHVPLFVSILFTSLLTLLVAAVSYLSFAIFYHILKPLTQQFVLAGFNLFFWLIVAFAWYRLIVTESQKTKLGESVMEQTEGVWPPAPRNPNTDFQE